MCKNKTKIISKKEDKRSFLEIVNTWAFRE